MKAGRWRMEVGERTARSVLECGDLSPLFIRVVVPPNGKRRGVGALQTLRDPGARNSFRFPAPSNVRSRLKSALLGALAALLLCGVSARAQTFALDWFTIDGGGGTSTGGVYSVSGTIGQPDAGVMTNGTYSLVGGFWGIVAAMQTPGAPLLSIERLGHDVRVFWPLPGTGFVLDQSLTVTGAWSQVSFPYITNATHISITVSPPVGNKFYRLRKP